MDLDVSLEEDELQSAAELSADQDMEEDSDDGEIGSFEEESDDDIPTVRQTPCWTFSYDMQDTEREKDVAHLFNSPHLADMTFLLTDSEDNQLPLFGHSFVLGPASVYFRCQYVGRASYITIDDVSFKHFFVVLKMIYCGWDEKSFPLDEVVEYYRVIRHLGVQDMFQWQIRTWLMKNICEHSVAKVGAIFICSYENNFSDVMRECLGEMADYPEKILKDKRNLKKLPLRAMIGWLERKYTNAPRKKLKKAVKRWIKANTENPDEEGKQQLLNVVKTVPYRHRGKRLGLQKAPGVALSYLRCDDEYTLHWAEQVVDVPLAVEDHEYIIKASFDIMFEETVKIYGLSLVFVKHKNLANRCDEIDLYGEVEICVNNNNPIQWAQFYRTIDFQEEDSATIECFFMRTVLDYDEPYKVNLHWKSCGNYPDVLTFDTPQNYVKTFGNCFITAIWYNPIMSY